MSKSSNSGYGIGSLLVIIFMVLKLCGVIDWSWWWVLAPVWIPASIMLLCVVFLLLLKYEE